MSQFNSTHDRSTGLHTDLVTLSSGLKLQFSATGPPSSSSPAIIILHGLGGSTAEWIPCVRLLSKSTRTYTYSRAGYHPSSPPVQAPTPASSAAELLELLQAAEISPPYLLIGHSHGGVLVRQCLADWPFGLIGGMVIVDSAPKRNAIPDSWPELLGGASYTQVPGLDSARVLDDSEWALVNDLSAHSAEIAAREAETSDHYAAVLRERLDAMREPLGNAPLSVICCGEVEDMRKVYAYGLEHGHGSVEAREAMRKRLEDMEELDEAGMREHLKLSRNARFVMVEGRQRTHNVHVVDPEFVAREVEWVFSEGRLDGSRSG